MLSPDVPEFIPRQLQIPNASDFAVDLKDTKYIPPKDIVQAPLESSYVPRSSQHSPSPKHSHLSNGHLSWRSVPRSTSPRGRGKTSAKSKSSRYGSAARAISNGEASYSQSNTGHTNQRVDNWRNAWRSRGGPPEETTRAANEVKNPNLSLSVGKVQSEKNHLHKDNYRKVKNGLQMGCINEHRRENIINPTVQEETCHVQIPFTMTHRRTDLSYRKILKGDDIEASLQISKPVTGSEMSVLQEDQWPTLNNTHLPTVPWVKRDFQSNQDTSKNNAWSVKKNDGPEKSGSIRHKEKKQSNENVMQDKILSGSAKENNTLKIVDKKKGLESEEVHKVVKAENHSNKSSIYENKTSDKSNNLKVVFDKNKTQNKNELHTTLNANSFPEERETTARENKLENSGNSIQDKNESDCSSKVGETDPFQWQIKGERKKQTKNRNSSQQTVGISVPVEKVFSKDTSKREKGSKSDNLGPSVRRKILQVETGRHSKDAVTNTSELNKGTGDTNVKKDSKVKKEFVKASDEKSKRFWQEKVNRKGNQLKNEQVQQRNAQGRVSSGSEQHDIKEPSSLVEAASSTSEHQKKTISEKDLQRLQELRKIRKEEKMRKKEQKLKKAQEVMKSDSKVKIITKEFLESVLAGGSNRRKTSNLFVSDGQDLNSASEEYSKVSKVKVITKDFMQSALAGDSKMRPDNSLDSDGQVLQLISEEYPSLTSQGAISSKTVHHENTNKKMSVVRQVQTDSPRESGGDTDKGNTFLSPNSWSKVTSSEDNTLTPPNVSSYSGALLAAKNVVDKKPTLQKVWENIPTQVTPTVVQKKKVKTKDLVEFDIMAAALQSKKNKRKDIIYSEEDTSERLKRETAVTLESYLGSPSKHARGTTAPSLVTKVKGVTNLKRGKQREGRTKKKVSRLKKCMQRARQLEVEAFLSVLQDLSAGAEKQKSESSLTVPLGPEAKETATESSHPKINEEFKVTEDVSDVNTDEIPTRSQRNRMEVTHAENDVDKIDNEQKMDPLTDVLPKLGHTEGSNSEHDNTAKNASEPCKDVLDGKSESKGEASLKEIKQDLIDAQSTLNEKERLEKNLNPVPGIVNLTVPSSPEKVNAKKPELCEKTSAEEPVLPTQNLLNLCEDPEKSKKFSIIAEELRALHDPIHKKKFREYCNHVITPEVNTVTQQLVESLVRFQDRHFQRDPTKARIRRRYVCGLKETTKLMGKMSCIIVAPDIQRSKGPGALDEVVEKMLSQAQIHGVPVMFALSCKRIGHLCFKKVPVSCFGIINYQGAQDKFQTLMQLVPEAKKKYQELVACGRRSLPVDDEEHTEETEPSLDVRGEVIAKTASLIIGGAEE